MDNINWFPGHMKKAADEVRENLALVDIVVEMRDARIPESSANPMLDSLLGEKKRVVVLTKADLADPVKTSELASRSGAVPVNAVTGDGIRRLRARIAELSADVNARLAARGRKPREIRVMVVGIPNVGKSTLINKIAGKAVCRAGNKPGVTRGRQWINIGKGISLCDTAGILWPKFENREIGERLAFTGAIRDEVLRIEELASLLLKRCDIRNGAMAFYGLTSGADCGADGAVDCGGVTDRAKTELDLIGAVAIRRGMLLSGGEPDISKAAKLIIDDFRQGRFGRFTLD